MDIYSDMQLPYAKYGIWHIYLTAATDKITPQFKKQKPWLEVHDAHSNICVCACVCV